MSAHSDFRFEIPGLPHLAKEHDAGVAKLSGEAIELFSKVKFADLIKPRKEEIQYTENKLAKIGTLNGTAVYCKDSTGEWESKDGKTWTLKGTNGNRVWHGEVEIKDGNYISHNADSGLRSVTQPDGTATRSFTDARGQKIEISTDAKGVATRCVDATGSWTSEDGKNWTNSETGKTFRGGVRFDSYGQYLVEQNGTESVNGRSRELAAVMQHQERLTREYGVRFPQPGEKVTLYEKEHSLRPPTTAELDCIERVLERNKQMDLSGLRLAFIQGSKLTDNEGLWGVHRGGSNEIVLYPRNNIQIDGWTGLEGTLQHELVHHEQHKNWGGGEWDSHAPAQARQLMRDFGWIHDEASGKYRILDKDDKQWQYNKDSGKWDPVIDGKAEPGDRSLNSRGMRDIAKVKPSTDYFNFPWEMHAEAQSMYRFDRHQLFQQSRGLYDLMKQYDQREINRKYGTDSDGQPSKIRGAEGTIVPNTQENRRAVEEMERRFSRTKASTSMQDFLARRDCCSACRAA